MQNFAGYTDDTVNQFKNTENFVITGKKKKRVTIFFWKGTVFNLTIVLFWTQEKPKKAETLKSKEKQQNVFKFSGPISS